MSEGRTDADRSKEITADKGTAAAAAYDPAARGTMGGQSGGEAHDGTPADNGGEFDGGQSNQGYYGSGSMGADKRGGDGHAGSTEGSSKDA